MSSQYEAVTFLHEIENDIDTSAPFSSSPIPMVAPENVRISISKQRLSYQSAPGT